VSKSSVDFDRLNGHWRENIVDDLNEGALSIESAGARKSKPEYDDSTRSAGSASACLSATWSSPLGSKLNVTRRGSPAVGDQAANAMGDEAAVDGGDIDESEDSELRTERREPVRDSDADIRVL